MQTVKYKGTRIHIGCEGAVVKGVCLKCGEREPKLSERILGKGSLIEKKPKLDEEAYKKRIRNMEDLRK